MFRLRVSSFGLVVLALFNLPAAADPIRFAAAQISGLDGISPLAALDAPDPSQGGTVSLGSPSLNALAPTGSSPSSSAAGSPFFFELGERSSAGAPGPFRDPWLAVSGQIQKSIVGAQGNSHLSGGYSGSATSITLINPRGADVPPAFLDLVSHPDRIRVNAVVTGGAMNLLQTTLSIAPPGPGAPTPVPEPTPLAVLLLGAGGWALRRFRRRSAR